MAAASNYSVAREDRLELATLHRGSVKMIDFVLSGGLDRTAQDLLGISPEPPTLPQDYIRSLEDM